MTRSLLLWTGILITAVVLSALGMEAQGVEEQAAALDESRADVLIIDTLAAFKDLEEQPVEYHHDKHTEALEKLNKDCTACHKKDPERDNRLSIKYMRLADTNADEIKEIYHNGCIGCHKEMKAEGKESGPIDVDCRGCHARKPKVASSWQEIGFDLSMHARHVKARKTDNREENCGACHHQYDEKTEKLVYVKNTEGSCRYCHKEVTEENRISLRLASHMDCVSCHLETKARNEDTGPVKCAGCHSLASQKEFEVLEEIPRMDRNQPDVVFIKTGLEDVAEEEGKDLRMNPVPFNHKGHETYSDTCRVCHHEGMQSCSAACHTLTGSEEGEGVLLERAMHQVTAEQSCVGCHRQQQEDKNCAGCHAFIESKQLSETGCVQCHMEPTVASKAYEGVVRSQDGHNSTLSAAMLLDGRDEYKGTFSEEDIPEKVTIKILADQYEPSELPHRKIVNKLLENIRDNKMANAFHAEKGTICQGCHHNSPASKKPPKCASCHNKPFDESNPLRPGLKAAYHGQCMGCHTEMRLEKPANTACTECHKEKKQ